MLHLLSGLEFHISLMLTMVFIFVLMYEAINGFHDTSNAVAIVIYTRALCFQLAVPISGVFNFFGVLIGGLSVAYAIVHLLPSDLLLDISSSHSLIMTFSILLSAILWNFGTWYFGLPASSSHALIGAIVGVGLTHAVVTKNSIMHALNIPKMIEIFLSLIISPFVGLILASIITLLLRYFWNSKKKQRCMHLTPEEHQKAHGKYTPSFWIRIALIFSSAGISFSHGANDGQKGIGLIMLILIGVIPENFVVNMNASKYEIHRTQKAIKYFQEYCIQNLDKIHQISRSNEKSRSLVINIATLNDLSLYSKNKILEKNKILPSNKFYDNLPCPLIAANTTLLLLKNLQSYSHLSPEQRFHIRRLLIYIADTIKKIDKLDIHQTENKYFLLSNIHTDLINTVEYAPIWVIIAVAIALSLGTMIGWRRVSVTIGEKIGKNRMTYAQGLSAQITAAISIGIASYTGIPVSTTHVLSSAVTGTMLIDNCGVQTKTIKNILAAWILTLPITLLLSSGLYWFALKWIL